MRRWLTAVALGCVTALAAAGCTNPGGVDGELTDDWAALSEPKTFVPDADACHHDSDRVGYLSSYRPVDCAQDHKAETLHLGTFTGKDASRTSPPPAGSPGFRKAWDDCDKKSAEALGADWRSARLSLAVVLPSPKGWDGGARWFRCDVTEIKSLDDGSIITRTGSLRGTLDGSSPLSHGCFKPKVSKDTEGVEEMVPVACDKPHRSEFVGIYTAPDTSYAAFNKSSRTIHRECLKVLASYAKLPNNNDMRYRSGTIFYSPGEREWNNGNHGVQCFSWTSRDLNRSVKGAGAKLLPVN